MLQLPISVSSALDPDAWLPLFSAPKGLMTRKPLRSFLIAVLIFATLPPATAQTPAPVAPNGGLPGILAYIEKAWGTLGRSMDDCKTVTDERKQQGKAVVYFPADMEMPPIAKELESKCGIQAAKLPQVISAPGSFDMRLLSKPGLLFLPNPYVVPGGFFNEMYGWDSYFIIRGLLQAEKTQLARGMVENFFFEIQHYGAILNANRTYFLTRSQPPFLSSMVLAVYEQQVASGKPDRDWLERAYPFIVRDYEMWTTGQHLAGNTGLSRYYDYGDGPTADIADTGDAYYAEVIGALLAGEISSSYFVRQHAAQPVDVPAYSLQVCTQDTKLRGCSSPLTVELTADYYKGDRAMRESGFDISFRFGPYSGSTHHYAPVCVNSLLYKTDRDLEKMSLLLGHTDQARTWSDRAKHRADLMNKYLWDPQRGMFYDWDFERNQRSDYNYATTFYPLWSGMASPEQARAVLGNLKIFEQPGGIVMSDRETKVQWDYPYGWAPIQMLTIEGMQHYKFDDDASRLSYKFLSMVVDNFTNDGTIREKYNVVTRSDEVNLTAGYKANVIGFGWTNGTFLVLLHDLPPGLRAKLGQGDRQAAAPQGRN